MKGQKKKAMWAKKRVENAEKRAAERKANTARKPRRKPEFQLLVPRETKFVISEEMERAAKLPSAGVAEAGTVRVRKPKALFTPDEYQAREAKAKSETDRKKKMVAPLYNKGGYQYVGDAPPEIIKNLGKKV